MHFSFLFHGFKARGHQIRPLLSPPNDLALVPLKRRLHEVEERPLLVRTVRREEDDGGGVVHSPGVPDLLVAELRVVGDVADGRDVKVNDDLRVELLALLLPKDHHVVEQHETTLCGLLANTKLIHFSVTIKIKIKNVIISNKLFYLRNKESPVFDKVFGT